MLDQTPKPGTAILLTCDVGYLPFALHLAWQVATRCPVRTFDILICGEVAFELPDWATALGIRAERIETDIWIDDLPIAWLSRATYLRLAAPEQLASRYARFLYLDCDIFLESGDLDRLLRVPMGGHAVAAVQDVEHFNRPGYHAVEFQAQGLGRLPYLNSGVMLIDTAAFAEADLLRRGVDLARNVPAIMRLHDQSILNAVLKGQFAELAPCWNWMLNFNLPFALRNVPIRLRHFTGRLKPWRDPNGLYELRHFDHYADFFRNLMPEAAHLLAARPAPAVTPLESAVRLVITQAQKRKRLEEMFQRFSDEWEVKI